MLPSSKEGDLHPTTDDTTQSPFALPGAMAAGIASRYKTGPRLDTYRYPLTVNPLRRGRIKTATITTMHAATSFFALVQNAPYVLLVVPRWSSSGSAMPSRMRRRTAASTTFCNRNRLRAVVAPGR